MKFPWPTDEYKSGITTSVAAFAVICTVFIFFDNRWHTLLEKELENRDRKLSQTEDFEERFHEEQVKRRILETRVGESSARIEFLEESIIELQSQKWHEKYETTHLQLITLQEEYTLTKKRYEIQAEVLKESNAKNSELSPNVKELVAENFELRDENQFIEEKLRLTQTELGKLREFHEDPLQNGDNISVVKSIDSDKQREGRVEALIVSVKKLNSMDARFTIQNGVANIGRISGDELVKLVGSISISSQKKYLIVNIAKYVEYPLNSGQLSLITAGMFSQDSMYAIKALQNEELKSLQNTKK